MDGTDGSRRAEERTSMEDSVQTSDPETLPRGIAGTNYKSKQKFKD